MPDPQILNRLFHSPLVGHAVVDGGCIRTANPAFERFTRYSAQQLAGLPLAALLHPDTPLPDTEAPARLCFRSSDGQLLWGDTCILPLDETAASVTGFILQVCDQTRVHVEQQLHKGRAQVLELLYRDHSLPEICETIVRYIEALGEGMRCSILSLDAERGTLHKVAAPSLPDFYSEAIEGMRIGDGIGSCGTAVYRRERVIVADILNHPYWERARRLIARTPMRACWSEPIVAHDGSVLGSFALYYDTPREPQPEELELITSAASLTAIAITYKRSQQVLRDLDRAKDEFVSIAAHELRTPLAAIMGYAEMLVTGEVDADCQRDYLTEIHARGEALERLIDELLDVSLIQVGRGLAMERQPTVLLAMVERVVGPCRRSAPLHQIELRCSPDLPVTIFCDAVRITQVLENLLGNAIKYSPQGGTVTLGIERNGSAVRFCVSDQGVGMSEDALRHAFDKFYREDASNTAPGGLGLGLCIVREIIDGHNGVIDVKSRPSEGTQVTFSLPI